MQELSFAWGFMKWDGNFVELELYSEDGQVCGPSGILKACPSSSQFVDWVVRWEPQMGIWSAKHEESDTRHQCQPPPVQFPNSVTLVLLDDGGIWNFGQVNAVCSYN